MKIMDKEGIIESFNEAMQQDPDLSVAIAALQSLVKYIEYSSADTMAELRQELVEAIVAVRKAGSRVTSISSGCDLFLRFITLTALDNAEFHVCKKILVKRGHMFLDRMASSRQKIATLAVPFITDGSTILLHSKSGVVLNTLEEAARHNKRFQVYITQSLPDRSGEAMKKRLDEANIPCTLILDSAVGYIMEKVDFVLVGAEGVVESGGIINQIGTYTLAICAAQMNKPLYALVESFKFVRLYPLNQQDVPNDFKYSSSILDSQSELDEAHPQVDYTPPSFITLLFTDLGVLTPSAVSDELIKLYL